MVTNRCRRCRRPHRRRRSAGSIAALVLARAGVGVTILDRASFPRDKLCGDSVNPGAMALLARHGLAAAVDQRGLPMSGMLVTGPGGVAVRAVYPGGVVGRSICTTRPRRAVARRGCSRRRACRAGRARRGTARGRRRRCRARHRRVDADGQGIDQPACSCRHCRRRAAVDAGPCARARAPPASPAPLGHRRLFRRRHGLSGRRRDARAPRTLHRRRAGARRAGQRVPGRARGARESHRVCLDRGVGSARFGMTSSSGRDSTAHAARHR